MYEKNPQTEKNINNEFLFDNKISFLTLDRSCPFEAVAVYSTFLGFGVKTSWTLLLINHKSNYANKQPNTYSTSSSRKKQKAQNIKHTHVLQTDNMPFIVSRKLSISNPVTLRHA